MAWRSAALSLASIGGMSLVACISFTTLQPLFSFPMRQRSWRRLKLWSLRSTALNAPYSVVAHALSLCLRCRWRCWRRPCWALSSP